MKERDASQLPSIEDVQELEAPLRTALELLDDNVRGSHDRISADARLSPQEAEIFVKASITVLLSVAASLLETAQVRAREPLAGDVFAQAAADAVRWAQDRQAREGGGPDAGAKVDDAPRMAFGLKMK